MNLSCLEIPSKSFRSILRLKFKLNKEEPLHTHIFKTFKIFMTIIQVDHSVELISVNLHTQIFIYAHTYECLPNIHTHTHIQKHITFKHRVQ